MRLTCGLVLACWRAFPIRTAPKPDHLSINGLHAALCCPDGRRRVVQVAVGGMLAGLTCCVSCAIALRCNALQL